MHVQYCGVLLCSSSSSVSRNSRKSSQGACEGTTMRTGLFSQREGPGSEPGNTLVCPDEAPRSLCAVS